jgi:hypothetical protein
MRAARGQTAPCQTATDNRVGKVNSDGPCAIAGSTASQQLSRASPLAPATAVK